MRRMVIKLGTGVLMAKTDKLDPWTFNQVAAQIASLKRKGYEVVMVSSGAIQAGREAVFNSGKILDFEKKDFAGIGSRYLINEWGRVFSRRRIEVAQILVTYANWESIQERESIKSSILKYLKYGIVPIINENDVVSQNEIGLMEKGISENDRLAGMIASLIDADGILFLTETDGVLNDSGLQIKMINPSFKIKSFGKSENGTGGMHVKIKEAVTCKRKGIKRVVIAGLKKDTIISFAAGKSVGTEVFL